MAAKGLSALRAKETEAQAAREERAKENDVYFKLDSSSKEAPVGETVKARVRPLQELDEDSKGFSAKAGVAVFDKQWNNPKVWYKVISDTMDTEGRCVGEEMSKAPTGNMFTPKSGGEPRPETGWNKGWKAKEFMYINVLVDYLDGSEPVVKVAKWNMNEKAIQASALIDTYDNSKDGTITDRWFAVSKTKTGTESKDVQWKMTPLDRDPDLPPVTDYELIDLESLLPMYPYAKQREALGIEDEAPRQIAVDEFSPAPATQSVSW